MILTILAAVTLSPIEGSQRSVNSSQLTAQLKAVHVNEVGRIPIVMYHSVGDKGKFDKGGLNISAGTFKRHLQLMYEAGWRPVNVRDLFTGPINLPLGNTPVALTFDDGRGSQMRYLKDGSVDPNCALGILLAFNRERPDWGLRGTFYLNSTRKNPVPFWQKGKEAAKVNQLIDLGFEVSNHSSSHDWMSRMGAAKLQFEVADCIRYVKKLAPRATMDTFCLPYGARPKTRALTQLLLKGAEGGTPYTNLCVLNAWGGAAIPPTHKLFDAGNVDRLGVSPGYLEGQIKQLSRNRSLFISDGDPNHVTVPDRFAKWVKTSLAHRTYDDGLGAKRSAEATKKSRMAKPKR